MTEAKIAYMGHWKPGSNTKYFIAGQKYTKYYSSFNKITGHILASILLSKILYWCDTMKRPFYKFKEPCNHELYEKGESWTEELGFSRKQFDTALKKIGTKVTQGSSKSAIMAGNKPEHIVVYWTDSNRLTWYSINSTLFDMFLDDILDEA